MFYKRQRLTRHLTAFLLIYWWQCRYLHLLTHFQSAICYVTFWRTYSCILYTWLYTAYLLFFRVHHHSTDRSDSFNAVWLFPWLVLPQMAFIIVAGICACLYFLFLCFMVFQVFRNISGKRTSLPAMSKARRLHYEVCVCDLIRHSSVWISKVALLHT